MSKEELITELIDNEWEMFHNVNEEDRVSCQNNRPVFEGMRRGQYQMWSEETIASYLEDVKEAKAQGRNLPREKYIRMMASTDPDGYEYFKTELPAMTPLAEETVEKIWEILCRQTLRMRKKYPYVGGYGRPLYAIEERGGSTSVETYQKSELMTYSEKTLVSLLNDINGLSAQGIEYAEKVEEESMKTYGFESLEAAEAAYEKYSKN